MLQKFEFHKTKIDGLIKIIPFNVDDNRGLFTKDYSKEVFEQNGISHDLQEVFYTTSKKGVIRAIHFQRVHQQAKLVRCIHGSIYDVVVDLRKNSHTFKNWCAFSLTGENRNEILVPEGCGHGYLVLEDSIVSYKCGEKFYGEYDDGIIWNDKDLNIDWKLDFIGGENNIILSDKDKELNSFEKFISLYGGF